MQAAWSPHDTRLILACAASLGVIVTLIGWLRVVPFLAILLGAVLAGRPSPECPPHRATAAFRTGAGSLLGDIGLIIALGALARRTGHRKRGGCAASWTRSCETPGRDCCRGSSPWPPW